MDLLVLLCNVTAEYLVVLKFKAFVELRVLCTLVTQSGRDALFCLKSGAQIMDFVKVLQKLSQLK